MKKMLLGIAIMIFGYFMGQAIGMRFLAMAGAIAGLLVVIKGYFEE